MWSLVPRFVDTVTSWRPIHPRWQRSASSPYRSGYASSARLAIAAARPPLRHRTYETGHFQTQRLRRRGASAAWLGVLATLACSEDVPVECERVEDGELLLEVENPRFEDPYVFTAMVVSAEHFVTAPPKYRYILKPTDAAQFALLIPDFGFGFPVEVGEEYTFEMSLLGGVPPANGLRILDEEGLRYMTVTDFDPSDPQGGSGRRVFKSGYGELGGEGPLDVELGPLDCANRKEDDDCYRSFRNRQVLFRVDGSGVVALWHGESSDWQDWTFRVHKGVGVEAACVEELQNQFSFFVERKGIRTP